MCTFSFLSRNDLSISLYGLEFRCRYNMQKIKPVSLNKNAHAHNCSTVIFVEVGIVLDWIKQPIGKIWQWSAI